MLFRSLTKNPNGASLRCKGVRFSYREGQEVLRGLDLYVPAGGKVAVTGASGVGKSTLAALFCGLSEPSHGTVEINGLDVRDADLESLRASVSLVSDTDEIFDGTIEENITLGRPQLSHEDVRRALDIAQLTNDIGQMPQGIKKIGRAHV